MVYVDAFFWTGSSTNSPSPRGEPIALGYDEKGAPQVLREFYNEEVLLQLPSNLKVNDIKWISVWCRRFTVSSFLGRYL